MYGVGGSQWGFKFWHSILAAYTKPNDIILHLLPDGPMLSTLGKVLGRHVVQADEDAAFLDSIGVSQETLIEDVRKRLPQAKRVKFKPILPRPG